MAGGERAQPDPGIRAGQGYEEQEGEAVAQGLAARVGVGAEDAVGGEGRSDEDAGERGEQAPARGGGVHGRDPRNDGGPV
ncbi:hypothetical protein SAMN04487983_1002102 [Streptomyces sp. yr375]|nr:hypothetical protein SAMN04487983_1002102 [Streptomyces sp. yr375]